VRNVDSAHSVIFTYALRATQQPPLNIVDPPPPPPTNVAEGMWWKQQASVTAFVAIANLSSDSVQASVKVTDSQVKTIAQHDITISPHGMKMVTLDELQFQGAVQGGIRVTSSETTDNLVISGGLEDQQTGYSAIMPFSTTSVQDKSEAATIAEIGLMAGAADPMMQFPAGTTFTPYTVVRNVADTPLTLTSTLWWMESGAARSAQLPAVSLQPYEAMSVGVASLLAQFGPKNFNGSVNLVFGGNVRRGSLVMASGSVDRTGSYVFEVVPRGVMESVAKSIQYWSTGNGDDTMVSVWNPTDESQDFVFTLYFEGGQYALPLHLEGRATRTFDVSQVIQNQVPDAYGNIIPASVHVGTAKIAGSHAENEHILVAIEVGVYNIRKATCGVTCQECDGVSQAAVVTAPFTVAVGSNNQLNFVATMNTGSQFNMTASWGSSASGIATVTGGLVHGVSPGSVTITAIATEPVGAGYICHSDNTGCPTSSFSGGGGGGVAKLTCPSSLFRGSTATCTVTPSSGVTVANWKFTDSNNTVVTRTTTPNSLTWSGTMVTSGTVSVTATTSGGTPTPLSAIVTVSSRPNFSFTAVSASKRSNPYTVGGCSISVPTTPSAGNNLGYACVDQYFTDVPAQVTDNGPNQGYWYVQVATNGATAFNYIIAGYLDNSNSAFATKQCGNYNAGTNTGFISYAQLVSNTYQHESGTLLGHYIQYKSTQDNPANNVGVAVESVVGSPGITQAQFDSTVLGVAQSKGGIIASAMSSEACNHDVRLDTSCVFRGFINWPTYATCP
jgi:hypothetical protein